MVLMPRYSNLKSSSFALSLQSEMDCLTFDSQHDEHIASKRAQRMCGEQITPGLGSGQWVKAPVTRLEDIERT